MILQAKWMIALTVIGVILVSSGAVVFTVFPSLVKKAARNKLPMTGPTSFGYHAFANRSSKTDIYQTFYVFHCLNPYEVEFEGKAPQLKELGPFTYLTTQWRDVGNISWKADGTIDYTYHVKYEFQYDATTGLTEDTNVTALDLAVIAEMTLAEYYLTPYFNDIKKKVAGYSIFVNVTVGQLIWGYHNPFLKSNVSMFVDDDPSSFSAPSAMYTGGPAAEQLQHQPPPNSHGQMTKWEGYTSLPYWGSPYANMINGTDGSCYPPELHKDSHVYIFVDSLYRSVIMNVIDDSIQYQGVPLLRFALSRETQQSAAINPDNEAFFINQTGFLTSPPMLFHPVWFSKPRFLDADPTNILVNITTPAPDVQHIRDHYDAVQDVEPIMGILFNVHKRMQINTFLQPFFNTSSSQQLMKTWYPVMWLDEHMQLPSTLVEQFKSDVMKPLQIIKGVSIAVMVVGSLLILLVSVLEVRRRKCSVHEIRTTNTNNRVDDKDDDKEKQCLIQQHD